MALATVSYGMGLPFHDHGGSSLSTIDETENFFDFNAGAAQQSSGVSSTTNDSQLNALELEGLDSIEEYQTPAKPSFAYDEHKQTTGLPPNSLPGIGQPSTAESFSGMFSNTGLDDMMGLTTASLDTTWSNSMDPMDISPLMGAPAQPFVPFHSNAFLTPSGYVNPLTITQQASPQARQRVFPGMHQQLAEQQRLQQQQQQQQQEQQQQAQTQHQQQSSQQKGSRSQSLQSNADIEPVIRQLVSNARQQNTVSSIDSAGSVSQFVRPKKDGKPMDEDEALLASEEGKKLSSKERRQLRNKVSARAFRSRRKEYITELEGKIKVRDTEKAQLQSRLRSVEQENAALRSLLGHVLQQPQMNSVVQTLSADPQFVQIGAQMRNAPPGVPGVASVPGVPGVHGMHGSGGVRQVPNLLGQNPHHQ